MRSIFEKLVQSPIKDPYKAQQARYFMIMVIAFMILLVIVSIILMTHSLIDDPDETEFGYSSSNTCLVLFTTLASYLLVRKGYYNLGIYIFLIVMIIGTTFGLMNRGLSFTIIMIYAIVVVTAGLLVGSKSSIFFASLSIISYAYVFNHFMASNQIKHQNISEMATYNFSALVASLLILAILTSIISRGLRKHVNELNKSNRARVKAINETKKTLNEKEILLREIHHRVKNNLQIISSLLSLQSTQHGDENTHKMLMDTQNRVKSMALIHEKLYMTSDISHIDFDEYLKVLVNHMALSYLINPGSVELKLDIDDIVLDVDTAISCGLVINELVSNSMKYAFDGRSNGIILISMKVDDEKNSMILIVSDNGIGIPKSLDIHNLESLGLQLVDTLVCEMKGHVRLISKEGTKFIITLPYVRDRGL